VQRDEVGVEPVRGPDPFGHQLGAVVAEQLQIAGERVKPDRRQLLAGGHPGDREHVGQRNLAVTANTYSHVLADETELDYAGLLGRV
jgi:hypothetical protein